MGNILKQTKKKANESKVNVNIKLKPNLAIPNVHTLFPQDILIPFKVCFIWLVGPTPPPVCPVSRQNVKLFENFVRLHSADADEKWLLDENERENSSFCLQSCMQMFVCSFRGFCRFYSFIITNLCCPSRSYTSVRKESPDKRQLGLFSLFVFLYLDTLLLPRPLQLQPPPLSNQSSHSRVFQPFFQMIGPWPAHLGCLAPFSLFLALCGIHESTLFRSCSASLSHPGFPVLLQAGHNYPGFPHSHKWYSRQVYRCQGFLSSSDGYGTLIMLKFF